MSAMQDSSVSSVLHPLVCRPPLQSSLAGRFVVGTPLLGGEAGLAFGGVPVAAGDAAYTPSHTHTFSLSVKTTPAGACGGGAVNSMLK